MDTSGVSQSNQSIENGKSKASMIQSKHAQFYSACFSQNFSLPNNIIYYISKNPKSAKFYQKMIQSCKYFFVKNPIIVISSLCFFDEKWVVERKPYDITTVTCKFWITDNFHYESKYLTINDKNIVSSIISKLYKCAPKCLTFCYQNIFFRDKSFLISSAEEIYFIDVCVKNDDGSNVAIEKIVEIAVKAKWIEFNCCSTITNKTMKELLKIPNFFKIDEYCMLHIPEDFDIETFYNHMKKKVILFLKMYFPTLYIKSIKIVRNSTIEVNITQNISFMLAFVSRQEYSGGKFQIQKMRGSFEIAKICNSGNEIPYNKSDKTMDLTFGKEYEFHILANVNFEPANIVKSIDILYHLSVSAARIKSMEIFQYMEKEIILPGYETLKFKCLIKKINSNQVEIHILNPLKIIINDNATDFHTHVSATEDIYLKLLFVLNPVVRGNVQNTPNSSAPPAYDSVFKDPLV